MEKLPYINILTKYVIFINYSIFYFITAILFSFLCYFLVVFFLKLVRRYGISFYFRMFFVYIRHCFEDFSKDQYSFPYLFFGLSIFFEFFFRVYLFFLEFVIIFSLIFFINFEELYPWQLKELFISLNPMQ
jgi:hypothetical protein